MKFKNAIAQSDYSVLPEKLKEICEFFETNSLFYGIEPVVTRVREGMCGDSGVHEAGRAVDFRDQCVMPDGSMRLLYTSEQIQDICFMVARKYPRSDGKPVILHHSFTGPDGRPQPYHTHIQIPAEWLKSGEPEPRPDLHPAS